MLTRIACLTLFVTSLAPTVFAQSTGATGVRQVAYDYSELYARLNPSIVKVFADSGHGSGFVVSADGLIATNHHVVSNARYTAVQFADGRKVAASLVLLDARFDVALLRINRNILRNVAPLTLLSAADEASLKAGIPVLAFGSPLSQSFLMTQGIVAKVEHDTLLGDFVIQPGNSGGPLVNLDGHVVGINTFGEGRTAGAVHVSVLRGVLSRPEVVKPDIAEPSEELLPVPNARRYPTETLKAKILAEPLDLKTYQADGGKFTVTAITPVLVGKMQAQTDLMQAQNRYQRRGRKMPGGADPLDQPFYEWYRTASSLLDSVVTFEVKPDFGLTGGSKWAMIMAGAAAGLSGRPAANTHANMEYKAEFQELKVFRDGTLLRPITPGRSISEAELSGPSFTFIDEAYSGMYQYDPGDFLKGQEFRLEIYDAREPGKAHRVIVLKGDAKIIQQIRSDFADVLR
jgi:S1-C subfamily serine protease